MAATNRQDLLATVPQARREPFRQRHHDDLFTVHRSVLPRARMERHHRSLGNDLVCDVDTTACHEPDLEGIANAEPIADRRAACRIQELCERERRASSDSAPDDIAVAIGVRV